MNLSTEDIIKMVVGENIDDKASEICFTFDTDDQEHQLCTIKATLHWDAERSKVPQNALRTILLYKPISESLNEQGVLVLHSQTTHNQLKNRAICRTQLMQHIKKALEPIKERKPVIVPRFKSRNV